MAMDSTDDYPPPLGSPTSSRLTMDGGWEPIDVVEPGPDWQPMPDGSFVSPDGSLRTWPQGNREDN